MLAALRSRSLSSSSVIQQSRLGFFGLNRTLCSAVVENDTGSSSSGSTSNLNRRLLDLEEVQKVLTDVKADDVKVIPVGNECDWTDFMVVATGRSAWHVRNIAQALVYKAGSALYTNTHTHTHARIIVTAFP